MRTTPTLLGHAVLFGVLLAGSPYPAHGQTHERPATHQGQRSADSVAVVAAVAAFHAALASKDTSGVEGLLSDDVRVLESGGLETREEYLSHHLPGDMAFAAALDRQRGPIEVTLVGDVAWAVSSSRTAGTFREREINSSGVELMVLTREGDAWRIRAIHWSSRQVRP